MGNHDGGPLTAGGKHGGDPSITGLGGDMDPRDTLLRHHQLNVWDAGSSDTRNKAFVALGSPTTPSVDDYVPVLPRGYYMFSGPTPTPPEPKPAELPVARLAHARFTQSWFGRKVQWLRRDSTSR